MTRLSVKSALCFLFTVILNDLYCQEDSLQKMAPKVYIDCPICGEQGVDYIRQNLTWVNYVRDRKLAQIHVIITNQRNGSGGKEYTLTFVGQLEFAGNNDTLVFSSKPDDTDLDIQENGLQMLKLGLIQYLAHTPLAPYLDISYDAESAPVIAGDKWDSWVFEASVNGWFESQESVNSINSWGSFNADRITPDWKWEFNLGASYSEDRFIINGQTVLGISRSQWFSATGVKSLSDHWSVGGTASARSSLYDNIKLLYGASPAIEYNIYPYSESTRRQLRIMYDAGAYFRQYNDTTIFDKTEELLWKQSLHVALEVVKTWGTVSASVSYANYLHDFSKYHVSLRSRISLRLLKGLSLHISGRVAFLRDQLALPKQGASAEEILLEQKELATNYTAWGNVGFSYTFGSIYNNVVNPRFGD
ncbi:MAG: hypothetical protein ACE5DN_01020 [Flavobacteriales bacterium]